MRLQRTFVHRLLVHNPIFPLRRRVFTAWHQWVWEPQCGRALGPLSSWGSGRYPVASWGSQTDGLEWVFRYFFFFGTFFMTRKYLGGTHLASVTKIEFLVMVCRRVNAAGLPVVIWKGCVDELVCGWLVEHHPRVHALVAGPVGGVQEAGN